MNADMLMGMVGIMAISLSGIAIYAGKATKKLMVTKEERDKLTQDQISLTNEKFYFSNDVNNFNEELEKLHKYREQLEMKEQAIAVKEMENNLTNFRYIDNLRWGVFYDKENDTIVTMDNLERIGDIDDGVENE